jgi:uncharacterized protein YjiS (DUF1127 family)
MSGHDAGALSEMAQAHPVAGPSMAGAGPLLFGVARRALIASLEQLLLWQERASQRHHLSMAEDHMLRDLGLSRAEVAREIKKPCWQP